jgi:hypothetical protein
MGRKASFLRDQRGVVSFEMPFVWGFLMFGLMLPLADVAIATFQFISAREALRAFGQSIQYSPPIDVTNASSWAASAIANADPRFPISNLQLICVDSNNIQAVCSASNIQNATTGAPTVKYYSYTTTVTLSPLWLKWLCSNPSCTFTLPYSERFE